jgi:hypothetical protein
MTVRYDWIAILGYASVVLGLLAVIAILSSGFPRSAKVGSGACSTKLAFLLLTRKLKNAIFLQHATH